jgi:hypothetical protein
VREVDTILARYPGPVTLTPSRLKTIALFAGSLAFVIGGVWVLRVADDLDSGDRLMLWLSILFFGLCALVGAVMVLPGAGSLTLAADGFEVCNLYKRYRTPWQDVSAFRVQALDDGEGGFASKSRMISFEIRTAGTGPERRGATMVSGALPDNYRLPKDDLAWLMTQWRERALAQRT